MTVTHGLNMGGSLMSAALLFRQCKNCRMDCDVRGAANADCKFEKDTYDATLKTLSYYQLDPYIDQFMAHRVAMMRVKMTRADMWMATSDPELSELTKVAEQANRLEKIILTYLDKMGVTREKRERLKKLQRETTEKVHGSLTRALSALGDDEELLVEEAKATRVKRKDKEGEETVTVRIHSDSQRD